jgi:hypothetical protein
MTDERDRIPLIFQAALASVPLLFIGLPAWLLVVLLRLFDIDASVPVGIVMACVLPVALPCSSRNPRNLACADKVRAKVAEG